MYLHSQLFGNKPDDKCALIRFLPTDVVALILETSQSAEMNFLVRAKSAALRKRFATHVAFERPLSSVRSLVLIQMNFLIKCFSTLTASEGLHAEVDETVAIQISTL